LYLRVSTNDQHTDNQLPVLEAWAKQRGFEIVDIYEETATSWTAGHQVELKRLMGDGRKHRFELVLVWALDRLSREGSAAILNIVNTLATYKVKVLSYQESWTEAPGELGELLYSIAGWVARMESQRRSERTKAGLARAIKEGKHLGRPKGSRDGKKRKRTGYLLRYANKESVK
ncbi:recombinase family protein, partial [Chloroflexota bacterium]